jgi:hypothetical protein
MPATRIIKQNTASHLPPDPTPEMIATRERDRMTARVADQRPCRGPAAGPKPSCYQLNVACDLSERRRLINDFAGALPPGLSASPRNVGVVIVSG